jgi:hypothetical protein
MGSAAVLACVLVGCAAATYSFSAAIKIIIIIMIAQIHAI